MVARGSTGPRKRAPTVVVAKKADVGAPTIEREELEDQPTVKRRLRARSTEEDVKKCERDNFSSYSHGDNHHNMVGGKSLRQERTTDIQAQRASLPSAPCMGKSYYESLRKIWISSAERAVADLIIRDHPRRGGAEGSHAGCCA